MKRISFLMITLLMLSSMVMAQGGRRSGDKKMDPKVRAERMTERMAKEYSLNDAQKKELLEANLTLTEKMGARTTDTTPKMKQGKKDKCSQDSCCCSQKGEKKTLKMSQEERQKMRTEVKTSREEYDALLKKIMTKEQYDSYTKKQTERQQKRQEGQRRG